MIAKSKTEKVRTERMPNGDSPFSGGQGHAVPIRKAHLELYKYMKIRHETGEPFIREDMYMIYDKYVIKYKYEKYGEDYDESRRYANASSWLSLALSTLIRRGYLGVTFRKEEA